MMLSARATGPNSLLIGKDTKKMCETSPFVTENVKNLPQSVKNTTFVPVEEKMNV